MNDPINIRASSIASIVDCPLRGLSIQLGLVKQLPSTPPSVIGTACHEGTAVYDRARMEGNPVSADEAADAVVEYIKHPRDEVDWQRMRPEEAERRALSVHTLYCNDVAKRLHYEQVELLLKPLIINVEGIRIELTGTLDRVYSALYSLDDEGKVIEYVPKGQTGILDVKTGAKVCSQKPGKHKAQIGVYELLAEATLGIKPNLPGLIAQLQTSYDTKAAIAPIENAQQALIGTSEQKGLLYHIATMLKTGDWYGNCSSWLCSEKYCPLYKDCIFR
jgi:hypothetical protein